jgi:hypothetical protein
MVFDVVPERMLELVRRMPGRENDQAVELWSWLFSPKERAAISQLPGVAAVRDLVPPRARGLVPLTLAGRSPAPTKGAPCSTRASGPAGGVPLT